MSKLLAKLVNGPQVWVLAALAAVAPVVAGRWVYMVAADVPQGVTEDPVMLACAGILVLTAVFVGMLALARLLFQFGGGMLSVARTLLDEAMHMKIAVVFIVLLLVIVPSLPFMASFSEALRYRVQSFLSYSMTATIVLLSLLTIFLACWTLSGEIEQKQIFTIATKPISRMRYMLGKWLGIVVLNGILLTVASLGIYGYTTLYLAKQQPSNEHDKGALEGEVLTARVARQAKPTRPIEEMADERLQELFQTEPGAIRETGQRRAEEEGLQNVGPELMMDLGADAIYQQLMAQLEQEWRGVPPMRSTTFIFDGLENAASSGKDYVQFRYLVRVTEEVSHAQVGLIMDINGERTGMTVPTGQAQVLPIPVDLIDDGRIEVTVHNRDHRNPEAPRTATLVFDGGEGLEVLYEVGGFGSNFARAMLTNWVKLCFLAMLGLTAATFLGFPVASLLSLLVFVVAMASPFFADAAEGYANTAYGLVGLMRDGISVLSGSVAMVLSSFAFYNPGPLVVDGRYVGWDQVVGCVLWIGVIWTGGIGLIGALVFRGRELAHVQV